MGIQLGKRRLKVDRLYHGNWTRSLLGRAPLFR
jgi:hypothetical protein